MYVDTVFYAERESLWQTEQHWSLPKNELTRTDTLLAEHLSPYNSIHIEKMTNSVFKGDKPLGSMLIEQSIKEIHLVGLDTDDCILASAFEALDLGLLTYVIEECSQSSTSDRLHNLAIELLRHQCMTNNSCINDRDKKSKSKSMSV